MFAGNAMGGGVGEVEWLEDLVYKTSGGRAGFQLNFEFSVMIPRKLSPNIAP